jgi:hypothetical protein
MLNLIAGAALASAFCAGAASAQTAEAVEAPAAAAAAPQSATLRLPMNTLVVFEFVTPLSSKTAKADQMFPIRLLRPIIVDGRIVVPAGTMGEGQVIQAAKSGWGGKAGELVVTARYLDFGGVRIPLRRFRMGQPDTGEDRKDEAFVATMVVPVAGFFMNGGEKEVAPGTRANAIVAADTDISLPAAEPAQASSN